MTGLLREIQAAHILGFAEMADFRRAVSRCPAAQPKHFLVPRKPACSVEDIRQWIDRRGDAPADNSKQILGMIDEAKW